MSELARPAKTCEGRGRPRIHPDQVCAHCGRAFRRKRGPKAGRPIRYCALACYFAATAAARVRICPQCGNAFEQPPQTRRKYCARACFDIARRHRAHEHICETCGAVFHGGSNGRGRVRRFCSPGCNSIAQRRPKVVRCLRCRKPVPKRASLPATRSGALSQFPKYCSDDCRFPARRRRDRRRALCALLRVLRRRLAALRRIERRHLGAFCLLACPNCGGRMPRDRAADRRRWCSRRCIKQMRKRYLLWTGLTGEAQFEMLLTLGLLKKANRLADDYQKGHQYAGNSEDTHV